MHFDDETSHRAALARAVDDLVTRSGGFASHRELVYFTFEGRPAQLIDYSRGIWNPSDLASTLSVVSDAASSDRAKRSDRPSYEDVINPETGLLEYSFQTGVPGGGPNVKLRRAIETGLPMFVFRKFGPNFYVPIFPAYAVGEDLDRGVVFIAMEESLRAAYAAGSADGLERRYVERLVRQRVHQPMFRARVLRAYSSPAGSGLRPTCAICRLRRPELLDAAHILADSAEGEARVTNGIALCKIHHAAYDNDLVGISPDYRVHVNNDLLMETDGPMLRHGIQEMHLAALTLPKRRHEWPSRDALDARFARFLK